MTNGPHLVSLETSAPAPPQILSADECTRLLGQVEVARVAWVDGDRARIVPVAIAVRDGAVFFRTGPGRKLEAASAGRRFTVEAEFLEPGLRLGWSVEAIGHAGVERVGDGEPTPVPSLAAWVPFVDERLIRVPIEEICGRRLPSHPAPVELWTWGPIDP
ncbi:MAG: pyridoxamine 5'-phosphate oxidase family protein [Sporichthyaceae bacterium]